MSKKAMKVQTLRADKDADIICMPVDFAYSPDTRTIQAFRLIIQTDKEIVEIYIGKWTSLRIARQIIAFLRGQMNIKNPQEEKKDV